MRVLIVRLILSLNFNVPAFYDRPVCSVKWRGRPGVPRRGRPLGDGADRIWNLAGEQFPVAVEIVDRPPLIHPAVDSGRTGDPAVVFFA